MAEERLPVELVFQRALRYCLKPGMAAVWVAAQFVIFQMGVGVAVGLMVAIAAEREAEAVERLAFQKVEEEQRALASL